MAIAKASVPHLPLHPETSLKNVQALGATVGPSLSLPAEGGPNFLNFPMNLLADDAEKLLQVEA